jgi:hypothetical protein
MQKAHSGIFLFNLLKLKIFKALGDYSGGVHLFPFRTEKLSPPAQMVLELHPGEYVVANFYKKASTFIGEAFFLSFFVLIKVILANVFLEDSFC